MGHFTLHARLVTRLWLLLGLLSSPLRADEATEQYNVASGFFRMNRFDFAAEEYEKFLKSFPNHEQVAEARYFLGESYYQLNKLDAARACFREVATKFPDARNHSNALYRAGETSHLLGDPKAAEGFLTEFIKKRPDDPLLEYALPYLGRVQLQNEKRADANATLRKAIEKFPKGRLLDQCQLDLAQVLEQLGEKDEAIQLYRKLASNGSSKLADDALLALGTRYFEDGDFESALRTFQDFEKRFASSEWIGAAKLNRALCHYQRRQFEPAQALLETATRGASKDVPEAWYWLGMTQKARGQYKDAAASLLQAFQRFPDSSVAPEMLFYASQALFQDGQFSMAQEQFVAVFQKFPEHEFADDGLYYAAESARMAGQHERSIAWAEQFSKEFPKSALAGRTTLVLGQSLIALGRHADAAKQLGGLAASQPAPEIGVPAQYYHAVALHAEMKYDKALTVLEPILVAQPAHGDTEAIVRLRGDAQFLAGSCYFEKSDYERAIRPLQSYLVSRPDGEVAGHAASYLAVSLATVGKFGELGVALKTLRKMAGEDVSLPAMFRVAEICFDAKQYAQAAELYNEVLQKNATGTLRANALSGLGWSQFESGNFSAAAQSFASVVESQPTHALASEAAYMRGRALEMDGKHQEAAAAYQVAVTQYRTSAHAFDASLQMARVLQKQRKASEAIAAYQGVAERFPNAKQLDIALYEWAWALQQAGREPEAQKVFERLATQFPESALQSEATINVCETLYLAGKFEEVSARLKPLLGRELPPAVREAVLYRLGRTHVELGAWSEAASVFNRLTADYPMSRLRREAEFWVAEAERHQGQTNAAIDRLGKLIAEPGASESWLGTAYLRMAQAYGEQKRWKEMLATLEQLKKQFPRYELVHVAEYHMGRALQNLARFDEAREAYRRGIAGRTDENAAQCQFMIGETFFHQRRYQEALREFLKVEILYAFPQWQAGALLEAGKCHESLQEWSRAAETYNRILEKYPKSTHVQEAAARHTAVRQKLASGNMDK